MRYKFIDNITSDVLFEAYGKSLEEVFENAAHAMFSVICEKEKIDRSKEKVIDVESDSFEDLMINWLSALIASVDIDEMFYSDFKVVEIDEKHLKAVCYGDPFKAELGGTVVKAVTYHQYRFEKGKDGYLVRVSLDI